MRNKQCRLKVPLLLAFLMFSSFSLAGCWSDHEINKLALINAMGIDRNDTGDFEVTILAIRPDALYGGSRSAGGGSSSTMRSPFLVTTTTGKSLYDAMQKLSGVLAKRMNWTHMEVVVFGEKIAREGVAPAMDMLKRHDEIRPNLRVLVTKGKAQDILKLQPQLENTLGAEIYNFTEYGRFKSTPVVSDLAEFMNALTSDTKDPLTGEISRASAQGIEVSVAEKEHQEPIGLSLRGLAVFKNDRLVGWLNHEEARGVSLLRGTEENGVIVLECPGRDGIISLEITRSHSQLKPHFLAGEPHMNVDITVDAEIREINCPDFHLEPEQTERLNGQLERKIRQQITNALNKAQRNWQADIFGFGEAIYKTSSRDWGILAPHWREGWLETMQVNLKVKANISRSGLLQDPAKANESR